MTESFTVKEVAAFLKASRQQVRRMIQIQGGELRAIKVGREYHISLASLAGFTDAVS